MKSLIVRLKKLYKLLPPLFSRDMRERYAGSSLGSLWAVINPLLIILLYWMVFSRFLNIKVPSDSYEVPFFIYLLTGILPWFMFQDGVLRGAVSIVEKGHIIKKVFFPAELFPLSAVLVSCMSYIPGALLVTFGIMLWKGIQLVHIFLFVLILCIQTILTIGAALLLASLTVYLRDLTQILSFVIQILLYSTTVLYPLKVVPEQYRGFLLLNPLTGFIESYHDLLLFDRAPGVFHLVYLSLVSLAVFFMGVIVFRKLKAGFVDVL